MTKTYRFIAIALMVVLQACRGTPPDFLASHPPISTDCPPTPNCVSSIAKDPEHYFPPIDYGAIGLSREQALDRLNNVIRNFPEATIVTSKGYYLHAEFESRLLKFVDDVEFEVLPNGTIALRSASRLGYSDLGVNRERMTKIRQHFLSATNP